MSDWSDAGFEAAARFVTARTGLTFPPERRDAAERAMRDAMRRAGLERPSKLIGRLERDDVLRDDLIAEVTVGETYFFREPGQFEFIAREVLPELADAPGHPVLRAWSAGCAAGEEPYSLAIVMAERGLLDRAWILGTDISRPRLAKARSGRYTRWSLRTVSPDVVDRWFATEGPSYQLAEPIRRSVEFSYLNLVDDEYPALALGIWGLDIILCRNVLIYFHEAAISQVAGRLLASLGRDGWLFLGASDPPLAELVPCDVVATGAGLAYRRPRPGAVRRPPAAARRVEPPPAPAPPLPPPVPAERVPPPAPPPEPPAVDAAPAAAEVEQLAAAYAGRDYDRVARLAEAVAGVGDDGARSWVLWVRALANQGNLEQAGRVCVRALERHRDSAELAYLQSVILGQAGRVDEAAEAARRALYLDHGLVVAHLALADALVRRHDLGGARRVLRNAERLLASRPADEVVPASDGETSGRLLQIVRTQLRLMATDEAEPW